MPPFILSARIAVQLLDEVPELMKRHTFIISQAFQKYEHLQSVMKVLGQAARRETHCNGSLFPGDYIVLIVILVVLGGYFMQKCIRRRGLPRIGAF